MVTAYPASASCSSCVIFAVLKTSGCCEPESAPSNVSALTLGFALRSAEAETDWLPRRSLSPTGA
eukprot:228500-Prymnesium_polylepis.1